ncbi:RteC domain-containing protein [Elizabethkingia ursingii]|uniref:RteC domain-containing protein n=1 Tax=Elizabethkingia ursingii TaxID=1756150 RepID=UPI00201111A4|nr:RteC domain-containing protein [Elizabethkingia ursingii]MCL1670933.1 RteC domain-containing protein [Elizabethkingia ursingii]
METKTFFRKVTLIKENLIRVIDHICSTEKDKILCFESVLMHIDQSVRTLKSMVSGFIFENVADEIYFFKYLKPYFVAEYIYFSTLLNIDVLKPKADIKALKKYYEKELLKIKQHQLKYQHFYDYYYRRATYLDHKYFVRKGYDLKMRLPENLYNYDDRFTTSHDQYVSCFLAYEKLKIHLSKSIKEEDSLSTYDTAIKLSWSSSKVALVELLYALYKSKSLNNGNLELSQLIRWAEYNFNLELGNYHKTIGEIRGRKNLRTKFLSFLSDHLDQYFYDKDE